MFRRGIVLLIAVSLGMTAVVGCKEKPPPVDPKKKNGGTDGKPKDDAAAKAQRAKDLAERKKREVVLNEQLDKFYGDQLKLANEGDNEAQLAIGLILIDGGSETGEKISKDPTLGLKWVRKAAEAGYAKAQWHLGHRLYKGAGVPVDRKEAFVWFKKSAEKEYTRGLTWLAICYYKGEGVPANNEQHDKWKKMAMAQKDWNEGEYLDEIYAEED